MRFQVDVIEVRSYTRAYWVEADSEAEAVEKAEAGDTVEESEGSLQYVLGCMVVSIPKKDARKIEGKPGDSITDEMLTGEDVLLALMAEDVWREQHVIERLVTILATVGIQCYEHETMETLAEAVTVNINDGTLKPDWLRI